MKNLKDTSKDSKIIWNLFEEIDPSKKDYPVGSIGFIKDRGLVEVIEEKNLKTGKKEIIYKDIKGEDDSVKKEGDIIEYNGKKYKNQGDNKWLEVSEHGKTKKQHENDIANYDRWISKYAETISSGTNKDVNLENFLSGFKKDRDIHLNLASKLSDKEHSDGEVGLGKKE